MRRFLNFLVVYLFNFKKIIDDQPKGLHQVNLFLLNLLKLVFLKLRFSLVLYIQCIFKYLFFIELGKNLIKNIYK